MMTGPSDIRTIQALQLIAVYSPITVLLDPETSQPLISGSMAFSTALKIARSMGLEYSSAHLSKLGGALYRREPGVEKEAYFLGERSILWSNLNSWDLHFQALERGSDSSVLHRTNEDPYSPEDGKGNSALLSSFIQPSTQSSQEEVEARSAGCVANNHRREVLSLYLEAKARVNHAGQNPNIRARVDELTLILNSYYSLWRARENDFNSLTRNEFVESIADWCRIEALCVGEFIMKARRNEGQVDSGSLGAYDSPPFFFLFPFGIQNLFYAVMLLGLEA